MDILDSNSESNRMRIPSLPKCIISDFGYSLKSSIDHQIVTLVDDAIASDKARDDSFKQTRILFTNTNRIAFGIRTGFLDNVESLITENENVIKQLINGGNTNVNTSTLMDTTNTTAIVAPAAFRTGPLAHAIERFSEMKLLYHFLTHGYMLPLSMMEPCNDDEYIGAVLGFAQDLARYAVGRAGEGDVRSVTLCKDLVVQLNGKMLEFNFRNGHLRRKYDSLKYSLRTLENSLCELSFITPLPAAAVTTTATAVTATAAVGNDDDGVVELKIVETGQEMKKQRIDDDSSRDPNTNAVTTAALLESSVSSSSSSSSKPMSIDTITKTTTATTTIINDENNNHNTIQFIQLSDLEDIRIRMEIQDAVREEAIKLSRDVQKLSKQAIYSTQRGGSSGYTEAEHKLNNAQMILLKLQELILQHPSLRYGAVSGCIEEWAEGKLFLQYCKDKSVATLTSLLPVNVDSSEYIGALSDFTGELGRVAVNRAAKRDVTAVAEILQVNLIISSAITEANVGGRYSKKGEAVSQNLKKVEDLMYELSLQVLGGRAVSSLREKEVIVVAMNNATGAGNEEI